MSNDHIYKRLYVDWIFVLHRMRSVVGCRRAQCCNRVLTKYLRISYKHYFEILSNMVKYFPPISVLCYIYICYYLIRFFHKI